jgi:hypothetical protein
MSMVVTDLATNANFVDEHEGCAKKLIIESQAGWRALDLKELWAYREAAAGRCEGDQ